MSNVVTDSKSQFYRTLQMYRNYVGYTKPMSYQKWLRLDDRLKAGALYCQFYNEITLAWYKVFTKWSLEEEGVECINQYLIKNVDLIKKDKARFDPRYIYKVAYNCLYCLCIDPSKNKDRYYKETPDTFVSGEDELSWFDIMGSSQTMDEATFSKAIVNYVGDLNPEAEVILDYVSGELTDYQAAIKLKRLGAITGNCRNSIYCSLILAIFVEETMESFKRHFKENF